MKTLAMSAILFCGLLLGCNAVLFIQHQRDINMIKHAICNADESLRMAENWKQTAHHWEQAAEHCKENLQGIVNSLISLRADSETNLQESVRRLSHNPEQP